MFDPIIDKPIQIPDDIQIAIMEEFVKLTLEEKLIIYAKMKHGRAFKTTKKDLFGMSKSQANKVYADFINLIRTKYAHV